MDELWKLKIPFITVCVWVCVTLQKPAGSGWWRLGSALFHILLTYFPLSRNKAMKKSQGLTPTVLLLLNQQGLMCPSPLAASRGIASSGWWQICPEAPFPHYCGSGKQGHQTQRLLGLIPHNTGSRSGSGGVWRCVTNLWRTGSSPLCLLRLRLSFQALDFGCPRFPDNHVESAAYIYEVRSLEAQFICLESVILPYPVSAHQLLILLLCHPSFWVFLFTHELSFSSVSGTTWLTLVHIYLKIHVIRHVN